jgi:hypothetical protein
LQVCVSKAWSWGYTVHLPQITNSTPGPIIKVVESKKMKFPAKAKSEKCCALSDSCCCGSTEFKPEFEAYLCDHHYKLIINKGWRDRELFLNER